MNTVAATIQPTSAAIYHVVSSFATPKATTPAASDRSTRFRAAPCELSMFPS